MTFDLSDFDHKDIVFVGVGKGRSIAGLEPFLRKYADIKSFAGVQKHEGNDPLGFLRDYDPETTVFFKNEAIPGAEVPVPYITTQQLFFRLAQANSVHIVGVTGTKGKSTTTALTAHILQSAGKTVAVGGNIGISPLPMLETATLETIFVLELSSYQLSDLQVSPHVAVCTNLYNDHTDWHGSIDGYWEAKHNIMRFASANDVFIYNPDFSELQRWADDAVCKTIAINPAEQLDLQGAALFGEHNVLNALMAREVARQYGIDDATSLQAIRSFAPLRHRMQTVATKHGRTYVDDAIGMTPESTMAGLTAITASVGPVSCLFLGGQDRNYDFSQLMAAVAQHNVPFLVLFPETEAKMKAAMPDGYNPEIFETSSMQDAVVWASEHAPEGSVILLSTAAPSYLLWKDFEDKGDQFQDAVRAL